MQIIWSSSSCEQTTRSLSVHRHPCRLPESFSWLHRQWVFSRGWPWPAWARPPKCNRCCPYRILWRTRLVPTVRRRPWASWIRELLTCPWAPKTIGNRLCHYYRRRPRWSSPWALLQLGFVQVSSSPTQVPSLLYAATCAVMLPLRSSSKSSNAYLNSATCSYVSSFIIIVFLI